MVIFCKMLINKKIKIKTLKIRKNEVKGVSLTLEMFIKPLKIKSMD